MSKRFFAIAVNQPGYSPNGVHHAGNSVEEARDTLLSEIAATASSMELYDEDYEKACAATKTANLNEAIMFGGYAHTIIETDEDGYDKE